MRGSTWMALTMMAAALAACSPKQQAAAPAPAAPVATPPAAPAPVAAEQPSATPDPTPAAAQTPTVAPATPTPPPEIVRFSPGDYPSQERRIDGLIANAVSRDTTGDTQQEAAEARAQRARCTTKACIKRSYATEEAKLRRWEGSSDVN